MIITTFDLLTIRSNSVLSVRRRRPSDRASDHSVTYLASPFRNVRNTGSTEALKEDSLPFHLFHNSFMTVRLAIVIVEEEDVISSPRTMASSKISCCIWRQSFLDKRGVKLSPTSTPLILSVGFSAFIGISTSLSTAASTSPSLKKIDVKW